LTRLEGESYTHFVIRCSLNEDAKRVKLEDLRDNMDPTRLKGLTDKDFKRMQKYQEAFAFLVGKNDAWLDSEWE